MDWIIWGGGGGDALRKSEILVYFQLIKLISACFKNKCLSALSKIITKQKTIYQNVVEVFWMILNHNYLLLKYVFVTWNIQLNLLLKFSKYNF